MRSYVFAAMLALTLVASSPADAEPDASLVDKAYQAVEADEAFRTLNQDNSIMLLPILSSDDKLIFPLASVTPARIDLIGKQTVNSPKYVFEVGLGQFNMFVVKQRSVTLWRVMARFIMPLVFGHKYEPLFGNPGSFDDFMAKFHDPAAPAIQAYYEFLSRFIARHKIDKGPYVVHSGTDADSAIEVCTAVHEVIPLLEHMPKTARDFYMTEGRKFLNYLLAVQNSCPTPLTARNLADQLVNKV